MFLFCKTLCAIIGLLLFRISFEGRENIPSSGAYILASNHHSLVDPVFISIGCKRHIYFMAKAELFKHAFAAWWLRAMGAFPVERGTGDTSSIDRATEILRGGNILGIFPEGTRSRDGKPGMVKSGVAYIARIAKCGIIPCAVIFDGKLTLFKKITVKFGKPIPYDDLGLEGEHGSIKRVSRRIMGVIWEMMGFPQEAKADEADNG